MSGWSRRARAASRHRAATRRRLALACAAPLMSAGAAARRAPPSMTTDDHDHALDDGAVVGVDAHEEQVWRMRRRMKAAMIGPEHAASAAGEAHAAEHDGRDAGERVGPLDRRADARVHRQRQAAHRREQAGDGIGRDLRPRHGDAAPEGGDPIAPDRVDRQPKARTPERDPDDADGDDHERRGPRAAHSVSTSPTESDLNHVRAPPPPGRVRGPGARHPAQTKNNASVTTMSGTRVTTTATPLTVPSTRPRSRTSATAMTPDSSARPCISDGGRDAGERHHAPRARGRRRRR